MKYKKKYNPFKRITHNWVYKNNVVKDTGRRFVIRQSKRRNSPSPIGSGVPLNSKFKWSFRGIQTTKKVKGGYKITLKGIKSLKRHKLGRKLR